MKRHRLGERELPRFSRQFFRSADRHSRIGEGPIGGKAHGLAFIRDVLQQEFEKDATPKIEVDIPAFVVLTADAFDAFLDQNDLRALGESDLPDPRLAHAFMRADLPAEVLGDLRALTEEVRTPLAVRSSSLLEDALFHPFAGIYETKMTPNNQPDPLERFRKLTEAVKLVYASTFFRAAKSYARATDKTIRDEKMAVIFQEIVGRRHGDRFYPQVSGVCRSFNFYAVGGGQPEDGVVDLALGLGKTIVDGGLTWTYSPAWPKAPPPFGSVVDMVNNTQKDFWAVNVGKPPPYDPIAETEYLVRADLRAADLDGALRYVASTYSPSSGRISPGVAVEGARVLNFAPLLALAEFPLNEVLSRLLAACERGVGQPVEIEFALSLPGKGDPSPARLGFLQVRPMVVSGETVEIGDEELTRGDLLLSSDRVMGNGTNDVIRDVVYVKPAAFEARHTRAIASHLEGINADLLAAGRPYLLIGFGRWGSADPWLGIPVNWGQISGAKVIVEATRPDFTVDPSQGSHFFHNVTSFRVSYFSTSHLRGQDIDWGWLDAQSVVTETELVRHARLPGPVLVKVDGRSRRGAVWKKV